MCIANEECLVWSRSRLCHHQRITGLCHRISYTNLLRMPFRPCFVVKAFGNPGTPHVPQTFGFASTMVLGRHPTYRFGCRTGMISVRGKVSFPARDRVFLLTTSESTHSKNIRKHLTSLCPTSFGFAFDSVLASAPNPDRGS